MKLFKLIYCRECQGYVAVQWLEYNHCNVSADHNLSNFCLNFDTNNMNQNCSQNSVSWAQNIPKMRLPQTPLGSLQRSPRTPSWVLGGRFAAGRGLRGEWEWGKEGRRGERKGKRGEGEGRGVEGV